MKSYIAKDLNSIQIKKLADLLIRVLNIENEGVFLYPRHAETKDMTEEAVNVLAALGNEEVKHFEMVSSLLRDLGKEPVWDILAPDVESGNIKERIERHLKREAESLALYNQCLAVTREGAIGETLLRLKSDEERHRKVLLDLKKKILK